MKVQILIISLLFSAIITESFATEGKPQKDNKSTTKSKYDFNIFKLYAIATTPVSSDSIKTKTLFIPLKRKDD